MVKEAVHRLRIIRLCLRIPHFIGHPDLYILPRIHIRTNLRKMPSWQGNIVQIKGIVNRSTVFFNLNPHGIQIVASDTSLMLIGCFQIIKCAGGKGIVSGIVIRSQRNVVFLSADHSLQFHDNHIGLSVGLHRNRCLKNKAVPVLCIDFRPAFFRNRPVSDLPAAHLVSGASRKLLRILIGIFFRKGGIIPHSFFLIGTAYAERTGTVSCQGTRYNQRIVPAVGTHGIRRRRIDAAKIVISVPADCLSVGILSHIPLRSPILCQKTRGIGIGQGYVGSGRTAPDLADKQSFRQFCFYRGSCVGIRDRQPRGIGSSDSADETACRGAVSGRTDIVLCSGIFSSLCSSSGLTLVNSASFYGLQRSGKATGRHSRSVRTGALDIQSSRTVRKSETPRLVRVRVGDSSHKAARGNRAADKILLSSALCKAVFNSSVGILQLSKGTPCRLSFHLQESSGLSLNRAGCQHSFFRLCLRQTGSCDPTGIPVGVIRLNQKVLTQNGKIFQIHFFCKLTCSDDSACAAVRTDSQGRNPYREG